MSSAQSLWESFYIFILLLVFAYILDISIGHAIDEVVIAFAPFLVGGDPGVFDNSTYLASFTSMFHLLLYTMPAIGLAQFIYVAIRRTRHEQYMPEEAYYA